MMLTRNTLRATGVGLHYSAGGPSSFRPILRSASTSTSTPVPPPRTARSAPKPRPASTLTPSTPFAPRPPTRASPTTTLPPQKAAWPWRSSLHCPAGYTDLERTIYARPFEGPLGNRVRMLWFLVPFWGMVVGFYLTTPELPTVRTAEGEQSVEDVKETVGSTLWYYATPVGMAATSIVCFAWLASPSRFVTRLTQVRRQAAAAAVPSVSPTAAVATKGAVVVAKAEPVIKEGEFIRMQHGGHLMCWGELERGREVAMSDIRINLLGGEVRSPYLSLRITPAKKLSLDSVSYRLDFRDTPVVKASEDEVVLSLSRIEHVFGKLT